MKNILELKHNEAREFLLKQESYINMDLPPYIKFEKLLQKLSDLLERKKDIVNLKKSVPKEDKEDKSGKLRKVEPKEFNDINYKLFHNKNGKYDWRQFELIHPLLYINLVNTITEEGNWSEILRRFKDIDIKSNVKCTSMPIVSEDKKSDKANQILEWWQGIEQKSLELSLEFSNIYHTDIENCYGSMYTHSISWAIHSKRVAKGEIRDRSRRIGDKIDTQIQAMSYGQTNGIPQGSVLMDFIAEIVLKYADLQLSKKLFTLKIDSATYKILRYRDDYRIFVNNPSIADNIIKCLSEVLLDLGLKLNSSKTISSDNVIDTSIKDGKINWLMVKNNGISLQKKLLLLHKFSRNNVNNGILCEELQSIFNIIEGKTTKNFYKYFKTLKFKDTKLPLDLKEQMFSMKKLKYPSKKKKDYFKHSENILVLLSIVVDIAFLNPRTYSISSAIISQLIGFIDENEQKCFIKKMMQKFSYIPNTGYMQIWIQRAIKQYPIDFRFEERICRLVNGETIDLWNHSWLNDESLKIFKYTSIIDDEVMKYLTAVIKGDEVLLFEKNHYN